MDLCVDPKPPEPESGRPELRNRRRMGIFPREGDAYQNAADEFLRRGVGTRYRNKVNRENSFQVPPAVSRKNETRSSSPPVLTVESKLSLKLFSELFLGIFPVDE